MQDRTMFMEDCGDDDGRRQNVGGAGGGGGRAGVVGNGNADVKVGDSGPDVGAFYRVVAAAGRDDAFDRLAVGRLHRLGEKLAEGADVGGHDGERPGERPHDSTHQRDILDRGPAGGHSGGGLDENRSGA